VLPRYLTKKELLEFGIDPKTSYGYAEWKKNEKQRKKRNILQAGNIWVSKYLEQLNGNWWFVLGNHDNPAKLQEIINLVNNKTGSKHRILGWYHRLLVKVPPKEKNQKMMKKLLVLCHFPIEEWDGMGYGAYMIHGHLHGGGSEHSDYPLKKMPNRFDVGIDNSHTYTPFTYEELRRCIHKGRNKITKPN
jgi:calcineurin-like phosphoesterase family protein